MSVGKLIRLDLIYFQPTIEQLNKKKIQICMKVSVFRFTNVPPQFPISFIIRCKYTIETHSNNSWINITNIQGTFHPIRTEIVY